MNKIFLNSPAYRMSPNRNIPYGKIIFVDRALRLRFDQQTHIVQLYDRANKVVSPPSTKVLYKCDKYKVAKCL